VILTNRFVWIHVPKTGGTWFRETLAKVLPPEWEPEVIYPEHHSWRRIPEEKRKLPRILAVRNPWDWYVSTVHFWRQHYIGRTGGYVLPATEWSPTERAWAERLERTRRPATEITWIQRAIRDYMADESLSGLLDFLADYWGEGGEQTHVISFENLRESATAVLRQVIGERLPNPLEEALKTAPPLMTSIHGPYRLYYATDQELFAEVAVREQRVIDAFYPEEKCAY